MIMVRLTMLAVWSSASIYMGVALLMVFARSLSKEQRHFLFCWVLIASGLYTALMVTTAPLMSAGGLVLALCAAWWARSGFLCRLPLLFGLPMMSAWMFSSMMMWDHGDLGAMYVHVVFAGMLAVLMGAMLWMNLMYAWQHYQIKRHKHPSTLPLTLLEKSVLHSVQILLCLLTLFLATALSVAVSHGNSGYVHMKLVATLFAWCLLVLWLWGRSRLTREQWIWIISAASLLFCLIFTFAIKQ